MYNFLTHESQSVRRTALSPIHVSSASSPGSVVKEKEGEDDDDVDLKCIICPPEKKEL